MHPSRKHVKTSSSSVVKEGTEFPVFKDAQKYPNIIQFSIWLIINISLSTPPPLPKCGYYVAAMVVGAASSGDF